MSNEIGVQIRIYEKAMERAVPDCCVLCHRPMDCAANSHSIPRFVLKTIDDEGWVFNSKYVMFPEDTAGQHDRIKNSGIFHLICNDCEHSYFADYEQEKNLQKEPTDRILAEIALKNCLLQLYKTRVEIEEFKIWKNKYPNDPFFVKRLEVLNNLDLPTFTEAVKRYQKYIEESAINQFRILFWKVLLYRTPIAVQGQIPLREDMGGRIVNDGHNYNQKTQSMLVAVLPMKKTTAIFAYYDRINKRYRQLERYMNASSDEKRLAFLNHRIIAHSDNWFFSKDILNVVTSNDALRKLSREIDGLPDFGNMVRTKEDLEFMREHYHSPKPVEIPNLLASEYAMADSNT